MVDVGVLVGVGGGVSVRVWVGIGVGEGVVVSAGSGGSVGVMEGDGEIVGEMINSAAVGVVTTSGSSEGTFSVRGTGKLHEIPRTNQSIPIIRIHMGGVAWFPVGFISTCPWIRA